MKKKVNIFVERILNESLSQSCRNCPSDITDNVFLHIGKTPKYLQTYKALISEGEEKYVNSKRTINQFIGQHIKKYWELDNFGRCYRPKSNLIKSYKIH